jgi:hypothetical protein
MIKLKRNALAKQNKLRRAGILAKLEKIGSIGYILREAGIAKGQTEPRIWNNV